MTLNEPQQDRSRATRQALLATTVKCLAQYGWEVSTVSFIARQAGVSRGAAQHHFPTRADLIVAALRHLFDERFAALKAFPEPTGSGVERVEKVVTSVCDAITGEFFDAALQVWTVAASDAKLREVVVPLEQHFGRAAHETTVRLLGVDDSDPHVRGLVRATLDLIRGLGLADTLTDDKRRRKGVIHAWSVKLASALDL